MLKLTIHRFFILFGVLLCMIVAAVVISGCGRKADSISGSLLEIDAMLQTDPDSAYALLEKVNVDSLAGTRDVNFYRLLTVEAQDKTFRDDTVYKGICEAAEYFDSIGDSRNAMRSPFYSGRIFQNRHEYGKAIISMLKAEEKADTTEHLYLGKIYNAISESYKEVCDAPQELKYAQMALEEYEKLDSLPFVNDAKLWLGLSLCRNNRADEGIELMTKTYSEAVASGDEFTTIDALQYLSLGYFWKQDWKNAKNYLSIINSCQNYYVEQTYPDLFLLSLIFDGSSSDSIEFIADRIKSISQNNYLPHQFYIHKEDYKNGYYALNDEFHINDSILGKRYRNDVALAINTHLTEERLKAKFKVNSLNATIFGIIVLSIIIILLISFSVIIYILNKHKREKEMLYTLEILNNEKDNISAEFNRINIKNEHLIDSNHQLEQIFEKLTSENKTLLDEKTHYQNLCYKNNNAPLVRKLFASINTLHKEYYYNCKTEKGKNAIIDRIAGQIKLLREDDLILEQLEDFINTTQNNLLSEVYRIKRPYPEQRRIISLSCLNFSKESICQIMGLSLPNYYTRMNRIVKRIESIESDRKDELLKFICKKEHKDS